MRPGGNMSSGYWGLWRKGEGGVPADPGGCGE